MAKAGNNKMMRGFVTGMMVICLATGGVAFYFYDLADDSVAALKLKQPGVLKDIKNIKNHSVSLSQKTISRFWHAFITGVNALRQLKAGLHFTDS